MFYERLIYTDAFIFKYAASDLYAGRAKHFHSTSRYKGVGITHSYQNTGNPCFNQCLSAWWSPAVMGAGFKGHIHISATRTRARLGESVNFRMGSPRFFMPAFTNDCAILDDNATDSRIRGGFSHAAPGQSERLPHDLHGRFIHD
jgi:hypothetical protein